jgi:NADP-dependent 3-hydroxy acid dehydrogenase YdfG
LSNGDKVAATSLHAADIEKQVDGNYGNLLPLTVDITNEESVANAISRTIEKFCRLDMMVNNVLTYLSKF